MKSYRVMEIMDVVQGGLFKNYFGLIFEAYVEISQLTFGKFRLRVER